MSNKEEAETMIRKARIKFLYETPFFANLSMYLNLREDKSVPTMGVDFKGNLYYNPDWVVQLTFKQLKTVVAHETLHLALQHLLRMEHRDAFLWNVAIDFAVNGIIMMENKRIKDESHSYEEHFELPAGILHDKKFNNCSAEEIYDKLHSQIKEIKVKGWKPLDEHIYPKIGENGNSGKDDKNNKKGKRESITYQKMRKERQKWKRKLVEASTLAKQMGKLPAGLERLIDGLLDSKINWKGLLYRYITQEIPYDISYSRPHKKSISVGVYMPYVVKENVELAVAIDTSGSISEKEFKEFMSEVMAITKSFANMTINLIICDCEIKGTYELRNGFDLDKVKIEGYGGTSFKPVYKWLEENKPSTKLLIYFTDAYGDFPEEETFKTIWVLPNDSKVPFGEKIIFGREE